MDIKSKKKQKNKLIRSTESIGSNSVPTNTEDNNDTKITKIPASTAIVETGAATVTAAAAPKARTATTSFCNKNEEDVMGGGFATLPPTQIQTATATVTAAAGTKKVTTTTGTSAAIPTSPVSVTQQLHEKLADNNNRKTKNNCKEKTEKLKLFKSHNEKTTAAAGKESKFAEKLRRSFRRAEHKSLEIKRTEKVEPLLGAHSPQDSLYNNFGLRVGLPQSGAGGGGGLGGGLHKNSSPSIFSLSNLPGLGGHINPALLLDSPDEATPPEYAYQHLSSVATTNSSTSLESNSGDIGERTSSQSSISYWAWQQSNSSMGGEVSTTSSSAGGGSGSGNGGGGGGGSVAGTGTAADPKDKKEYRKVESQYSCKSEATPHQMCNITTPSTTTTTNAPHTVASRSCSITSDSSSTKLTRLQNFLFKSSNESSKSYQGHSNEAFTVSSHNSSSGEWENLSAFATTGSSSNAGAADFYVGSFPEEEAITTTTTASGDVTVGITRTESTEREKGNYYQYTLTSPNNPFLPEIIARTYHSTYDEEDELDPNVAAGKYVEGAVASGSVKLPTPVCSRAGSQESTHSDGGVAAAGAAHVYIPTSSPVSSSSSTPGRQKRKLFSLNSPTRHLLHHQQQQQKQQSFMSSAADTATTKSSSPSGSFVHSLNPFLSSAATSNASSSQSPSKRGALKQTTAVTSPIAVPQDLNAKREEFLRATMKICLVVSPPSSKLQLKSKSLTHLDGLDSMIACHHGGVAAGKPSTNTSEATTTVLPQAITVSPLLSLSSQPMQQQQQQSKQQKFTHQTHNITNSTITASTTTTSRSTSPQRPHAQRQPLPPIIHTQKSTLKSADNKKKPSSSSPTTSLISSPTSSQSTIHTSIASSCCKNKICCLSGSTSILGMANHMHQFQSSSGGDGNSNIATDPTVTATGGHHQQQQQILSPTVVGFNTATCSISSNVMPTAGSSSTGVTPTSHKKKPSFMQRKKPLLTRSEVSSSEFFSVSFCTEQGFQDEEFIPATRGVTLLSALSQALKRRNLTFSQIAITDNNAPTSLLDAGSSPLAGSLDENTEVENLAGRHLTVIERDGSRKMLQKAASFGSRTRPPRLLQSASTEETTDSTVPGKQLKQRFSGLFGIKNPQQNQLCELLNGYAKNGVPQKSSSLNFDHPDFDAALEYLDKMHKTWRDFVESDAMSESDVRIQTAIWELVTTEVYYIHALQTVTDLFLACLEAVQEDRLLTDVDQHRLFSNVRDICEANLKFWTLYLYPMVAHCIRTREPLRIGFFQQGFVAFASIFAPYKKYCAEQSTCQFYCKELNRNNALFTSYLAWCESQKMCNRLRLADILVRPMQRLTKYGLLLAAIKKHMSDVEEIEEVDTMIHTVENFVFSVNNHLTTRQENERLKGVMARIESYDAVDTNNEQLDKIIKQYSQMFDLCAPMKGCPAHQVRHLFMEGDHRYKDNLGKADVHCFLLTDMLLVCKTIARKGLGSLKVIRQPYLTDRLVVQQTNNILNCVYLNEFQVAITAFTLQCSEAKNWYESMRRAKTIYTRLKQGSNNWDSFRFGGSGPSGGTADSLGIKKSPMNSSICSHVSSANNSHSGSVEWNDSRNISVDFEKTNSLSSDEGSLGVHGFPLVKGKNLVPTSTQKLKVGATANTLSVQPSNHLGQSLPNLNLNHSHTNLYHTYSNNTLHVPGTTTSHSGNLLLSPSHRGISYPPPSPTRVPLRRGMAFSTSIKNPPLVKTRNITSQNSINWHQTPATPASTPTPLNTLQTIRQHNSPNNNAVTLINTNLTTASGNIGTAGGDGGEIPPTTATTTTPPPLTSVTNQSAVVDAAELITKQLSNQNLTGSNCQLQRSNETDV